MKTKCPWMNLAYIKLLSTKVSVCIDENKYIYHICYIFNMYIYLNTNTYIFKYLKEITASYKEKYSCLLLTF